MLDQTQGPRRKIAIVGGGISGLSAAYYLSSRHDVVLYEAAPRLGGHARTVIAGKRCDQPVDTGFIVFNYATYPYLTRLFRELDVPVKKSDMSFAASLEGGRIEYALNGLQGLTAQKRNLLRPGYYRMIADILRFGKAADQMEADNETTIGELVSRLGLSASFRDHYLLPMCGAIWSTPEAEVDAFPAQSLIRFFKNHGLLASAHNHQWWTVEGGSVAYVRRLEAALIGRGCTVMTATPVKAITRTSTGIELAADGHETHRFDEVVLACHSDQALKILGSGATLAETRALSAIRYQPNTAVLHCDPQQMPRRKACWASWSYRAQAGGGVGVTYWMNRLQNIPQDDPLFVTLNAGTNIPEHLIYDQTSFAHPVFDKDALRAQGQIRAMQGDNNTWFAGAYNRHGFHEDGIASAMRVVRQINSRTNNDDVSEGLIRDFDNQRLEKRIPVDLRAPA